MMILNMSTLNCVSACRERPRQHGLVPSLALFVIAAFLTVLTAFSAAQAQSEVRLLMIEQHHCEWCEAWNKEVGDVYAQTDEGKRAPLIRSDITDPLPEGVEVKLRTQFTPTFILLHNKREVGRIEGYPGEHFFWPMLNQLLDRVPKST